MGTENEDLQEDAAAEQAAAQLPKEEDVRKELADELGLDEEADKDKLDKLVKREMDSRTRLSKTIGQKIKHRDEAARLKAAADSGAGGSAGITAMDAIVLAKAGIETEDIEEVVEYAKYRKTTISEALKDRTLKSILEERKEERETADASATGKQSRGTSKPTGEQLLERAEKTGEVPEDDEGMRELFKARQQRKLNQRKNR